MTCLDTHLAIVISLVYTCTFVNHNFSYVLTIERLKFLTEVMQRSIMICVFDIDTNTRVFEKAKKDLILLVSSYGTRYERSGLDRRRKRRSTSRVGASLVEDS